MSPQTVTCPVCSSDVLEKDINFHLDNNCAEPHEPPKPKSSILPKTAAQHKSKPALAPIFGTHSGNKKSLSTAHARVQPGSSGSAQKKRAVDSAPADEEAGPSEPIAKRIKTSSATVTSNKLSAAPLAERLRPQTLEDFVGQPHLTAPDSLLMGLMRNGSTGSMIFWGPPGCGKTTLSRLLAKQTHAAFKELSATDAGIAEVRAVAEEAKGVLKLTGRRTILFLDEVHRFNKAQQDIFLPFVEQGVLQLIGATTENPSFKLTGALLSRCRVFVLERLTDEDMKQIILQAVKRISPDFPSHATAPKTTKPSSTGEQTAQEEFIPLSPLLPPSSLPSSSQTLIASQPHDLEPCEAPPFPAHPQLTTTVLNSIISLSSGDARAALSLLELVLTAPPTTSPSNLLASLRHSVSTSYDRTGDDRYDMISALHKSVRGSDGNAALYWLARMLGQGEDPLYVARRMVVCASEDIGLADNHALPLAMATLQACQVIGMPECRINLAHLVSYLSEAPKSTRAYNAYARAEEAAKADMTLPVPMMVRNAPTKMMKEMGYSNEYRYNPDYIHPVTNEYIPARFKDEVFLKPEGDLSDKSWDEDVLKKWEEVKNGGRPWSGRGKYESSKT